MLHDEDKRCCHSKLVSDRIKERAEFGAETLFPRDIAVGKIREALEAEDEGGNELCPVRAEVSLCKVPEPFGNIEHNDKNREHQDPRHGEDIWNSPHGFLPEIFYNTFTFYSRKTLLQIFMYSYQSYMDYSLSVL